MMHCLASAMALLGKEGNSIFTRHQNDLMSYLATLEKETPEA